MLMCYYQSWIALIKFDTTLFEKYTNPEKYDKKNERKSQCNPPVTPNRQL